MFYRLPSNYIKTRNGNVYQVHIEADSLVSRNSQNGLIFRIPLAWWKGTYFRDPRTEAQFYFVFPNMNMTPVF